MLCRSESLTPIRQRSGCARGAFTLFELLLVCAVIVLLGAMIYPSIEGMYSGYRVGASADQVRAAWAQARRTPWMKPAVSIQREARNQ